MKHTIWKQQEQQQNELVVKFRKTKQRESTQNTINNPKGARVLGQMQTQTIQLMKYPNVSTG